jgi:hypothetical protein
MTKMGIVMYLESRKWMEIELKLEEKCFDAQEHLFKMQSETMAKTEIEHKLKAVLPKKPPLKKFQ